MNLLAGQSAKDLAIAAALLAGTGVVVWVLWKGPGGLAKAGAGAAVDAVDGVIAGTVEGVGSAFGIPETDMDECQRALAEGRYWDASFACPLKDFVKGVVS